MDRVLTTDFRLVEYVHVLYFSRRIFTDKIVSIHFIEKLIIFTEGSETISVGG